MDDLDSKEIERLVRHFFEGRQVFRDRHLKVNILIVASSVSVTIFDEAENTFRFMVKRDGTLYMQKLPVSQVWTPSLIETMQVILRQLGEFLSSLEKARKVSG